jgi:molybdenum cofactor cytidylyltransferase
MISALLRAAGASRRMGERNQLLLPSAGRTLIEHTTETVCAAAVDEVIVVLGHEADRVQDVIGRFDVHFTHNPRYAEGMTTSIQAGVRAASAEADGYLICLSDLPLVERADLDTLVAAFKAAVQHTEAPIVVPVYRGRRGNPALFASAYRADILAHEDPAGCRQLVQRHAGHVVAVEMPDDHTLVDIDTPEAYRRLRA